MKHWKYENMDVQMEDGDFYFQQLFCKISLTPFGLSSQLNIFNDTFFHI